MAKWTDRDFHRRHYSIESPALDEARRIELKVIVDGKVWVHTQSREPGIVAFVSRAEDQGFEIEIVEAKGVQFINSILPSDGSFPSLEEWQKAALDL